MRSSLSGRHAGGAKMAEAPPPKSGRRPAAEGTAPLCFTDKQLLSERLFDRGFAAIAASLGVGFGAYLALWVTPYIYKTIRKAKS